MPYSPATDITFGSSATSASVNNRINPADTYLGLYDDDIESIRSGWIPVTIAGVAETWTYSSVSGILGTITVTSDATTRFQKGDKIKFTQSATVKYFYVTSVTATTIVVTGGTDYTLTNVAISQIFISRIENPFGYPSQFNDWIAPTLLNSWANFGAGYNTAGYRLNIKTNKVELKGLVKSGSPTTSTIFTLPIGYRSANTQFIVTESNSLLGGVTIGTTGDIQANVGSSSWLSLDGISFYT
jgi:hypothetical protein